jgi:hypothetical protein
MRLVFDLLTATTQIDRGAAATNVLAKVVAVVATAREEACLGSRHRRAWCFGSSLRRWRDVPLIGILRGC